MDTELADFLHYCRVERRLAELTCTAYERDVRACMRFLQGEGYGKRPATRGWSPSTSATPTSPP